jgi:hypothetical protein
VPKRLILATAAALLAVAVGLQLAYSLREVPQPVTRERIAAVLPKTLEGWSVVDEPLGQTEAVSEAALKILNLDDYVYRRFSKDGQSFTVYAAYWAPGRMPTRLVASHTPDRCWTENGMRCVDMRFQEQYTVREKPLLPAEYRVFTPGSSPEKTYVAYWHTVEGKLYDYGDRFNAVPHPWLWWKDTLAQAAYGSREQLFVRIASTTPLDELWQDRDFQTVMERVAELGLWAGR